MHFRIFLAFSLVIFLNSCIKKNEAIYLPTEKTNPYEIYEEGLKAFKENDFLYASKKFTEAELNFDIPKFAAKAAIMSSYSLYGINFYEESEENIERYLKNYPVDKHVIYAHYLLAVINFEQIGGEQHDLKPLLATKEKIDFFLEKYPDTEYAIDLKFKQGLLENQFAAKELYIAKYYILVQKWVPAINRLKSIVKNYDKTIFIEEALHRLVEIHYHIGLEAEANKYASILGYNYNSSEWFKQSYKVLNRNYNIIQKNESKRKKSVLKKIINIIK
jgi:outer membrane protein assembly factor BamD